MAHVAVTINGRQFRMACDDGQEEHLMRLAADIDAKVDQLRGSFGEIGDVRLTVMAAIMVADEAAETKRKLRVAETELQALRESRLVLVERGETREAALTAALNHAADAVERIAAMLEAKAPAAEP